MAVYLPRTVVEELRASDPVLPSFTGDYGTGDFAPPDAGQFGPAPMLGPWGAPPSPLEQGGGAFDPGAYDAPFRPGGESDPYGQTSQPDVGRRLAGSFGVNTDTLGQDILDYPSTIPGKIAATRLNPGGFDALANLSQDVNPGTALWRTLQDPLQIPKDIMGVKPLLTGSKEAELLSNPWNALPVGRAASVAGKIGENALGTIGAQALAEGAKEYGTYRGKPLSEAPEWIQQAVSFGVSVPGYVAGQKLAQGLGKAGESLAGVTAGRIPGMAGIENAFEAEQKAVSAKIASEGLTPENVALRDDFLARMSEAFKNDVPAWEQPPPPVPNGSEGQRIGQAITSARQGEIVTDALANARRTMPPVEAARTLWADITGLSNTEQRAIAAGEDVAQATEPIVNRIRGYVTPEAAATVRARIQNDLREFEAGRLNLGAGGSNAQNDLRAADSLRRSLANLDRLAPVESGGVTDALSRARDPNAAFVDDMAARINARNAAPSAAPDLLGPPLATESPEIQALAQRYTNLDATVERLRAQGRTRGISESARTLARVRGDLTRARKAALDAVEPGAAALPPQGAVDALDRMRAAGAVVRDTRDGLPRNPRWRSDVPAGPQWITPEGANVAHPTLETHAELSAAAGLDDGTLINSGWIRRQQRGAYEAALTGRTRATIEQNVLEDIRQEPALFRDAGRTINIDDAATGTSYSIPMSDFEAAGYRLDRAMQRPGPNTVVVPYTPRWERPAAALPDAAAAARVAERQAQADATALSRSGTADEQMAAQVGESIEGPMARAARERAASRALDEAFIDNPAQYGPNGDGTTLSARVIAGLSPQSATGAVVGGAGGYGTAPEDATPQERLKRTAIGALGGAVVASAGTGLVRGFRAGQTAPTANRAMLDRILSPGAGQSEAEIVGRWHEGNRAILDRIGNDRPLLRGVEAAITGDLPDSYLSSVLHRKAILRSTLETEGLHPDVVSEAVDRAFDREMAQHYGGSIPDDIKAMIAKTHSGGAAGTDELSTLDTLVQRSKNTMFGLGDIGVFGVQGLNAIRRGSIPLVVGTINRTLAGLNLPHIATEIADSQLSRATQYAGDGLHMGIAPSGAAPEVGTVLSYLGKAGKAVDRKVVIPLADKLTKVQFENVLGTFRNLDHEGNLVMLRALGRDIQSPRVRAEAAANANTLTSFAGSALQAGRRSVEGKTLTSPSMTRARVRTITQMARLVDPTSNSSPEQRIMAASMIASTYLIYAHVAKAINDAIGTRELQLDPSKPGFGVIRSKFKNGEGQNELIDVVPQDSVERAFALSLGVISDKNTDPLEAQRAWERVALGSGSILTRAGAATAFRTGFEPGKGYRYGDLSQKGIIQSYLPTPPVVQNLAEKASPLELGYGSVGGSAYPESRPAAAWNSTRSITPLGVEKYGSYSEWRKATEGALRDRLKGAPMSEAEREQVVSKALATHPVSKAYSGIKNGLEARWATSHLDEAAKLLDEEARMRPQDRSFTPDKDLRALIEARR